ncbi:MAG TPA: hypothetical protein DIV80_03745 [Synergistaceae bacterium]|nr:hypothetical protein [Synergistaceae bacterium]
MVGIMCEATNARDKDGGTPLYYACEENDSTLTRRDRSYPVDHLDIARTLIEAGADVNAKDIQGWTPLHEAAEAGRTDIVQLLLDHGADVNARASIQNEVSRVFDSLKDSTFLLAQSITATR